MKTLEEIKTILQTLKPELEQKYNVREIGIFGSWVKQKQNKKSDLDILIDFKEPIDLFTYIEIENILSKQLKLKVDLVMKSALKPYLSKIILQEVIYL